MFQKKAASTEPHPARSAADRTSRTETVIGSGVQIKGDIKAPSNVELCGTVEGSFEVDGHFVIRESGRLIGNVSANDIVVEGEIEGQVVAAQKVELGSTGRIQGDVQAKAVSIAEGAFFQGKVQMAGSGSGATSKKKEGVEKPAEAYAAQAAVGGRAPVGDPAFTKR